MDKTLRNQLASTTLAIRRLLESEFARQLEGDYDIFPDGRIGEKPSAVLTPAQRFIRAKMVADIGRRRAKGQGDADSVAAYVRECAFTFLNRLAALKMMEPRGLVQECVSRGAESPGFREFVGLAPALALLPDKGYRLYLESLWDEIGREVGVLFNRHDSTSLLWPARRELEDVLEKLNAPALASVWGEDETIGWIYQYYNDPVERKKMRDESAAPRNSRELAVRNQFFTPRYVVEFLTDNTLGRIWLDMTRGETVLAQRCRYLVRRPGEPLPERGQKDPREIRFLDPACGSMHFGLYAFDLFETIYAEAWDAGCATLRRDFPDRAALVRETPRLIIEHNIHGIDIDPRAAQIAALALWLRAQKTWQAQKISAAKRPSIRRANIVCAEPMPGDPGQLQSFCDSLHQAAVGQMVAAIFEKMTLAGEAGSLLKIEEQITDLIHASKLRWTETYRFEKNQSELFSKAEIIATARPKDNTHPEFDIDFSGITDDSFWERAEDAIYAALAGYARQSEAGDPGHQRRLFADDTARGFAFIDVCRKRYDVVVMNPPFGEWSARYKAQSKKAYPQSYNDILAAFVERGGAFLNPGGRLGAITSRTCFFLSSFTKWREHVVLGKLQPELLVDLGHGVMDAAMVEAAAYVLAKPMASTTPPKTD